MKVLIAGASGLIGTALQSFLRERGDDVVTLTRRPARTAHESQWDPQKRLVDADVVHSSDVVVNLAGASIGAKRLTKKWAQEVLQSRLDATGTLIGPLASAGQGRLVQASAMGFYGDRGEEPLDEDSAPGSTLLSSIVQQWEKAATPAVEAGVSVAWARTGLVLAGHGGFAERLLPLVKRGLLRSLGSGQAWHSWITLDDEVRALAYLIDGEAQGPHNLVSPNPVRNRELIASLSQVFGKKPGLPVPAFALRIAIGKAIEDLLSSQSATPTRLLNAEFDWHHPDIASAAQYVRATSAA